MKNNELPPRIKILLVITKSNWGGAQRYVFDLATKLDATRFEVVVALGGNGLLANRLVESGIRVVDISALDRDVSLRKEIRAFTQLWKVIQEERPAVLHVNSSKAGFLGCLIGRLLRVPHIIFTAHGWAFNETRPRWQKILIKALHWFTVTLSHQTIAVSKQVATQMDLPFVRAKFTVIYNARELIGLMSRPEARAALAAKFLSLNFTGDFFWTVTIGELHKIKRHDVTIRALAQLRDRGVPIQHTIIGEGAERAALTNLISELNLTDSVHVVGELPDAALYLKAFDTFIISSDSEALCYVLIEARLAELAVVATDVGGIPEIITHQKNGLLIPRGDVTALATAIAELLSDQVQRQQLAVAQGEAEKFAFETMIKQTIAVYRV